MSIDIISSYSILAPALVGAIFFTRLKTPLKLLFWFVVFTCAVEIAARIMFQMKVNNMLLFHAYSFVEFACLSAIYFALSEQKYWRWYIISAFVSFQLFSTVNLFVFENTGQFNSLQRLTEGVLLMSFLIGFIHRYSSFDKDKRKEMQSYYWLTYGFIVYFIGTLFLFAFANEILKDTMNDFWTLHGVFNIFLNGIYATVFIGSSSRKR